MSLFFKISYLAAGGIPYVAVVQPTSTVYSDSLIFGYSDNKMALNLGLDIEVGIQGGIQLTEEFGATDKPCGVRTVANPKQLLNGT